MSGKVQDATSDISTEDVLLLLLFLSSRSQQSQHTLYKHIM